MKKFIYFSPLIITLVGIGFGFVVQTRHDPAYLFGFGLGFMLCSAAPASLVALIHFYFGKKKSEEIDRVDAEIIDMNSSAQLKRNYWYYLCLYTGIIGILLSLLMIASGEAS